MIKPFWKFIFILCAVFAVFSPALDHSFIHWDDDVHCYANPDIRALDLAHIRSIFTETVNKTYIPLTIFSYALEYSIFKDRPFIYHLDNILLHLGVVTLVFFLGVRLGLTHRAAAVAALVFGIHPMHVESVVWVTQRKDVLYALFYLLSCWHYVGFLDSRRQSSYGWALIFGFLSILSKPMALSLPLVLCLIDWFKRNQFDRSLFTDKVPFALIIFPIAWITYAMNMRAVDLSFPQAPLVWLWSMSFYLTKFMLPVDLLPLYQLPSPVPWVQPSVISAVVIGLLIRLRRHRLVLFAFGYFFLSIFFLLRFDNRQDLSFVADRFMYLPSFGFCLLFGFMIDRAVERQKQFKFLITVVVSGILLILGVASFRQAKLWGDELALWSRVTRRFDSAAAYNHLGNYFLSRKDYAQALTHYDKVIALDPRYHKPYGNRGIIHMNEGNFDAAIADFTLAIQLNPDDAAIAYNNRGYAYSRSGRPDEALKDYDSAIALDPLDVRTYLNRATVYKDRGDLRKAMADMRTAVAIDPDNQFVQRNMEWLQQRMSRE